MTDACAHGPCTAVDVCPWDRLCVVQRFLVCELTSEISVCLRRNAHFCGTLRGEQKQFPKMEEAKFSALFGRAFVVHVLQYLLRFTCTDYSGQDLWNGTPHLELTEPISS
eukprot:6769384-Prymnesium_polylepis.1